MTGTFEATLTVTSVLNDGTEETITRAQSFSTSGKRVRTGAVSLAPGVSAKKILFDASDASFSDQLKDDAGVLAIKAIVIMCESAELDATTGEPARNKVMIELQTDVGGPGVREYTIDLPSGSFFVLFSTGSFASYVSPFAGGTLDSIERVYAQNLSASTAARVGVYVVA